MRQDFSCISSSRMWCTIRYVVANVAKMAQWSWNVGNQCLRDNVTSQKNWYLIHTAVQADKLVRHSSFKLQTILCIQPIKTTVTYITQKHPMMRTITFLVHVSLSLLSFLSSTSFFSQWPISSHFIDKYLVGGAEDKERVILSWIILNVQSSFSLKSRFTFYNNFEFS
jgi:hypothetical protein